MKIIAILTALLCSCGKASADNISIQIFTAPDGVTCYVIVQDGEAKGGNCK